MRNALFVFCVLVSASCCIYTAAWLYSGQRQKDADQALADRFGLTACESAREMESGSKDKGDAAGEITDPFGELLSINSDVVGWLKIDGTAINHPILQSDDNTYYLSHDLYKEPNWHGAIFLDYRNEWYGDKIIYGHHMKDGTMFHDLMRYKDEAFRREHDTVLLCSIQGIREVYRITDVLYWDPASTAQGRSLYEYLGWTKDDIPGRPLLYLTTCDGPAAAARLIVVAGKEPVDGR